MDRETDRQKYKELSVKRTNIQADNGQRTEIQTDNGKKDRNSDGQRAEGQKFRRLTD